MTLKMDEIEKANVGNRIRAKRLEARMSRAKLASAIGCSPSRILPWEKGKSRPNPIYAVKLSRVMKCPIVYIYPEWNEMSPMEKKMAQKGLDSNKLADLVGVHRNSIIEIKEGRRPPSIEMENRIARELGCSAEELNLNATRRTPRRELQKDGLTAEQLLIRNELFSRNTKIIESVVFKRLAMIMACGVDEQDARQVVAARMCSALDKLIMADKKPSTAFNYLSISLDRELVSYCLKEKTRGMTGVPKGFELSIISLDGLISDGFQI